MHFFCSWVLIHFLPEATFLVTNTPALSLDPTEALPDSPVFSCATLFQHSLPPAWIACLKSSRLLSSPQLSSPLLTDSCCLPCGNYIAVFWLSRRGFCVPLIYFNSISLLFWCWLLERWIHDEFLIIFILVSSLFSSLALYLQPFLLSSLFVPHPSEYLPLWPAVWVE